MMNLEKNVFIMKIKLAILEKDSVYLHRIVSVFNNRYADKLEVYSFTDRRTALETAPKSENQCIIAGDEYRIVTEDLPERCAFAWFVDTPDVEHIGRSAAICKYQKIDMIYRQVVSLYSEMAVDIVTTGSSENQQTRVITALLPAGGVGSSAAAAACEIAFFGREDGRFI